MEIEIFTLADFANDYGNGKLIISGTFDAIFSKVFPVTHPQCSIAIRLRVANMNATKYSFNIKMIAPNKSNILNIDGEFDAQKNLNTDYSTINLVFNLTNTKFDAPGKYGIEFYINGNWERGLSLNLINIS